MSAKTHIYTSPNNHCFLEFVTYIMHTHCLCFDRRDPSLIMIPFVLSTTFSRAQTHTVNRTYTHAL